MTEDSPILAPPAFLAPAPAKLNLFLRVLGRRPDGYHELHSLVAFADTCDLVHVAGAESFSFTATGPMAAGLDAQTENLCIRAAFALAAHVGRPPAVAITLVKYLPVASGIGGGSSDAAATLRALVEFWSLSIPEEDLAAIASDLGADVPACLAGVPAEIRGFGEIVEPVPPLPEASVVMVNPGIPLPTARVFHHWSGAPSRSLPWIPPATIQALGAALARCGNDLTAAAIAEVPDIAQVLDALAARPDCLLARMSGSGATCFGLFEGHDIAQAAAEVLQLSHPAWWVRAARLLPEAPAVALTSSVPPGE